MQNNIVDLRARLAEKMAGEITLSQNPGETIKKWRKSFEVSQIDLANHLSVSPSVISDYESGRRKSPGTTIISKIVEAMLDIDEKAGSHKIRAYESMLIEQYNSNVILDIHEYRSPIHLDPVREAHRGGNDIGQHRPAHQRIYDHRQPQRDFSDVLQRVLSTIRLEHRERADLLQRFHRASPMVALRVSTLKPAAVVLHGLEASKIDPVAKKIAEAETFPLMSSTMDINR